LHRSGITGRLNAPLECESNRIFDESATFAVRVVHT
jgi:hypothetical protein